MNADFFIGLLPGLLRLLAVVAVGVFVGVALELTGRLDGGAFLARPIMRLGRLPPVCGAAFLTAFVSPRAANGMLAGAHADGRLSRRSMLVGALTHAFPASFAHVRVMGFAIIPLLGWIGVAYVGFQMASALLCLALALTLGRLWPESAPASAGVPAPVARRMAWRELWRTAGRRAGRMLWRVLLVTAPLYVAVAALDRAGIWRQLAGHLPAVVTNVLPAPALVVVAAHLSDVMNAAVVAAELLRTGHLTGTQVLLALVIGYGLTMPLRAVRHSLPAALGVFPRADGLTIVAAGQLMRLFCALAAALLLIAYQARSGGTPSPGAAWDAQPGRCVFGTVQQ